MSNLFSGFSATTIFPDHDICFGDPTNTSGICQIPSDTMIRFLNISSPSAYLDVYCNNPPADSCAFGYCPNPDVASPAVRYSTYFTSVVSAILVLYSPEDVQSSFFAQLLNVYSLIVAAIVSISGHNLTKLHSVIALTLAASPLSLYLLLYVFRSLLGGQTRLQTVFGPGMYLNRTLVLLMLPLWASVLSFTALPASTWNFQQAACDITVANNHIASLFFLLPFILFFFTYPGAGALIIASIVISWGVAIWRLRKIIWGKGNKKLPLGRLWRKCVLHYPVLQFYSVILLPHAFWIFNVEIGLRILSTRERFSATYGQLLAIFVTVPPFIQLVLLLPRLRPWFLDLYWVRFVTGRRDQPYYNTRPVDSSALPMQRATVLYDSSNIPLYDSAKPYDPAHAMLLGDDRDKKVEGLPYATPYEVHELQLKSAGSSRQGSYME
ncbi:hypothetical protein C8F04DRAFT_1080754 [Mycena alexandri]|uniref:Uncharacterized protein n=1 Tax=Mycena alexandri TaxID=1745969 RepID=A0AAD6TA24_9AGAR|nr:hypothetical protein C8F04DRAFT_1080754 [Mycena alexandri]